MEVLKCGCLMVSALDSRVSGPGSCCGCSHCLLLLGKTLYSPSAYLHPARHVNGYWRIVGTTYVVLRCLGKLSSKSCSV